MRYIVTMMPMIGPKVAAAGLLSALEKNRVANCLKTSKSTAPMIAAFATDYRATGDFNGCINRFKERMSDPIADNIVEALRVTREVGGTDLGRLLSTLAGFLRENSRTRAELEARQSWTVNAARLAIAAPWIVLLLMATQPAALQAYNSLTGYVVMLGGAGISVLAYRLMLRIGALPPERRVLR